MGLDRHRRGRGTDRARRGRDVDAAEKRAQLQERFGSEYDRTVSERDDRRAAEKELAEREKKRERLDIVPLSPEAQKEYSASWQEVQGHFVDDPSNAVDEADRLVTDVMRDRGYPIDDFEQRADDISVDHPTSSRTTAPRTPSTSRRATGTAAPAPRIYDRDSSTIGRSSTSCSRHASVPRGGESMTQPNSRKRENGEDEQEHEDERALFDDSELQSYRGRWERSRAIRRRAARGRPEGGRPRLGSRREAHDGFAQTRSGLEEQWKKGEEPRPRICVSLSRVTARSSSGC